MSTLPILIHHFHGATGSLHRDGTAPGKETQLNSLKSGIGAIPEHYKVTCCRSKCDYTLQQEDFKACS